MTGILIFMAVLQSAAVTVAFAAAGYLAYTLAT